MRIRINVTKFERYFSIQRPEIGTGIISYGLHLLQLPRYKNAREIVIRELCYGKPKRQSVLPSRPTS